MAMTGRLAASTLLIGTIGYTAFYGIQFCNDFREAEKIAASIYGDKKEPLDKAERDEWMKEMRELGARGFLTRSQLQEFISRHK